MSLVWLPALCVLATTPWWCARPEPPRRSGTSSLAVDAALLHDLACAALRSGVSVPDTITALGAALGGRAGEELSRVGDLLLLGADWEEAWGAAPAVTTLARALQPAWRDGVDPVPLLVQHAHRLRAEDRRHAQQAASRLGVRLVLPLGLCFLPAFVLLGVVPVLLAAGGQLLGP